MRNKNDPLIGEIQKILIKEISLEELLKSIPKFSVPEIVCAIQEMRSRNSILGKNLQGYGYNDVSYYNSLDFWSDIFRPIVIMATSINRSQSQ